MTKFNQNNIATCAVIGQPINHSLSPQIHQSFAQQCQININYHKISGDPDLFEQQVQQFFDEGGLGLNITLPFKERAFKLATNCSTRAQIAGAANTLWCNNAGQLHADNTDGLGLVYSLNRHIAKASKQNILLLGAGGAAKGVIQPLLDAGHQLTIANRSIEKLPLLQQQFPKISTSIFAKLEPIYDVIINATNTSLTKEILPIPTNILKSTLCIDMFYNLTQTTHFCQFAKKYDAKLQIDGLEMLVGQAAASFLIWHKVTVNPDHTLAKLQTTPRL